TPDLTHLVEQAFEGDVHLFGRVVRAVGDLAADQVYEILADAFTLGGVDGGLSGRRNIDTIHLTGAGCRLRSGRAQRDVRCVYALRTMNAICAVDLHGKPPHEVGRCTIG